MSVIYQLPSGWLLDHLSFINKINYQLHQHHEPCCNENETITCIHSCSLQVDSLSSFRPSATFTASDSTKLENEDGGNSNIPIQKYVFRSELFDITKPYITSSGFEDCQRNNEKQEETSVIRKIRLLSLDESSHLIQEGLKSGFLRPLSEIGTTELQTLQLMGADISVAPQDLFSCIVENNSIFTKIITLMGQKYLVPPKSSFLLSDISCMQPLLNYRKKYDVIVIDPPWQNKSVKRSNRYSYFSPVQIKQIPVPELAASDCLVITWVTNRQKHLRFVKEELHPFWSVEVVAEWHWVKITCSGEFVFPSDSLHKKPYEVLILGRIQEKTALSLRNTNEEVLPIPD